MLPAATHGDLKHVPTTHSEPGSDKKFDDITKITPISTDCPAFPSALILGSGSVFTFESVEKGFSIFKLLFISVSYTHLRAHETG